MSKQKLIDLLGQAEISCSKDCRKCEYKPFKGDVCRHSNQADYLLKNGVIAPPVKIGDSVFEVQGMRNRIQEYEITSIIISRTGISFTWELKNGQGIYRNIKGFGVNEIGKTIFLTQKEAERELNAQREKNENQ